MGRQGRRSSLGRIGGRPQYRCQFPYTLPKVASAGPPSTAEAATPIVCKQSSYPNKICNASFQAVSTSDAQLPESWSFAKGWEPPVGSKSTVYRSSTLSGDEGVGLKLIRPRKEDDPILFDSEVLVPVEVSESYRLSMKYRMDILGDDKRSRIGVETRYLDAEQKPIYYAACSHDERIPCSADDECGDENLCSRRAAAKQSVVTPHNPAATATSGTWRRVQTTLTPKIYNAADGSGDIEARYAKIRLYTNSHFSGEASIREISMLSILNSDLGELPIGAIAYDLAPLVCVDGEFAGDSCQEQSDCGAGRCGTPSGGFETLRSAAGERDACGFTTAPTSKKDHGFYPTQLLGRNVYKPQIECLLDGSSDYVVSLYMGGYWRKEPRSEIHQVTLNDAATPALDESRVCTHAGALNGTPCNSTSDCGRGQCPSRDISLVQEWINDLYYERVNASLIDPAMVEGRGHAIYDEYIWPRRYRRHDLPAQTDGNGRLRIGVDQGFVTGMVITPGTAETADLSALDRYDRSMRQEFASRWANFVEPTTTQFPVVQGSYEPSSTDYGRGYVLFHRHWMDFVEFSSRPNDQDVIHDASNSGLAIQATPGEYEPLTFSLWPVQPLESVTLDVSDLLSTSGNAIPKENISTGYLQSRPQRLQPPTRFTYLSSFLPDWNERNLHKDLTQRAWLNVHVPNGTPAGIYSGTVTIAASNVPSVQLAIEIEVLPFELVRPERTHLLHLGPGSGIIMPDYLPGNRNAQRKAASQHLKTLGAHSEIGIWWPSLFRNKSQVFSRDENGVVEIHWDAPVTAGTPDQQVAEMRASNDHTRVWIDSNSMLRLGIFEPFGAEGSIGWTLADTRAWLQAVEERFGPNGYGFNEILLHVSAEENHYQEAGGVLGDTWYAWLDYLAFVADNRSSENWPHVRTVHTFNTAVGQEQALAQAKVDFPAIGIFHGVQTRPEDQIFDAKATGKPFFLYGFRGRLVPGFYLWKSGASGIYHEWYTRFEGVPNDDWDNGANYSSHGRGNSLLNEGPGWANAHYSADAKMVGSWMSEELREGIDDDAYMTTLEHWISRTASDARSGVVSAREAAIAAVETIRSQIDLDSASVGFEALEVGEKSAQFGRYGLNLVRHLEGGGTGFDRLRQIAIGSIRNLVTAHASAAAVVSSPEFFSPQDPSSVFLRSVESGDEPPADAPPAGDEPLAHEEQITDEEQPSSDPDQSHDADSPFSSIPEPNPTWMMGIALLSLTALIRGRRARPLR